MSDADALERDGRLWLRGAVTGAALEATGLPEAHSRVIGAESGFVLT